MTPVPLLVLLLCILVACGGEANADACAEVDGDLAAGVPAPAPEPGDGLPGPAGGGALPEPSAAPFFGREDAPFVQALAGAEPADWPAILERRRLRVLVVPSRTGFSIEAGRPRGLELELFRAFAEEVNATLDDGAPFEAVFVPVEQELLFPALQEGRGDVAAGLLTATAERREHAAFGTPYLTGVDEIVVASPDAPRPLSTDDLAGRVVHAPAGSSYVASLRDLARAQAAAGLVPVDVRPLGHALTSEDLLELVATGAIDYTVCDDHLVQAWRDALPDMVPCPDVIVRSGADVGWATRRDTPELRQVLDEFLERNRKGSLLGNILFKRYLSPGRPMARVDGVAELLGSVEEPLQRLAADYGFDWRLIAAQTYQESRFDPDARSRSGAVGLMQLLPATAKDMGFDDVRDPEANLHAGIKYMAWLRDHFFDEPSLPRDERVRFALAAYNAGVGRVRRWRAEAASHGLDADRWHGHVEHLALADVGLQPVTYVDHIEKYVVGLSLLLDVGQVEAGERTDLGLDGGGVRANAQRR